MIDRQTRLLAYAPGGRSGAIVAAAASRAGALGVMDFVTANLDAATIAEAVRLTDRSLGIRVPASLDLESWASHLASQITTIIGTESTPVGWTQFVRRAQGLGRFAVAEVTSMESAREAVAAGADGLVAAGHEAGGRVSELSTLIFTQALVERGERPVWARGGIGPEAAAGCVALGASGVVADAALLLARESPLDESSRNRLARVDGSETVVVGPGGSPRSRVLAPPSSAAITALRRAAREGVRAWNEAADRWIGWGPDQAMPIGQDGTFAAPLASRFATVGGIVTEILSAMDRSRSQPPSLAALREHSPLARSHGTRFPIVQGPMTRVSDCVEFALAVAQGGALPMLALAMLKGTEVRELLSSATHRLEGMSWGVGLLGFVDPDLRREQIAAVLEFRPPFALIAGGRPDQARVLDDHGIATYLHAPSPGLLKQYLQEGSRRFVFEGRECGGHVGPRSSLILWQQAISTLIESIHEGIPADQIHALFAGGIHDRRSAQCVEAMAAPLAALGARVGVLVGTAYLFTREAVQSGAIVGRFQDEAIRCGQTVLLETGPGHEVRVAPSPYVNLFDETRDRLTAEGKSPDELREALESLNVGRLRVAAKGVERAGGRGSPLVTLEEAQQYERGLYMLGQAALLRDQVTTIADLHESLCGTANRVEVQNAPDVPTAQPSDVAIVGLSAIFPGAVDARTFWENTLQGLDTITEIPADRWDWRLYYDPDPRAPDKIVSRWGGFVPDIPFDPLRYGITPNSLTSIEPVQLLTLEAVRAAIDDAGYTHRPFPKERTSVVLGIGGGAAQMAMGYAFRAYLPMLDTVSPGIGKAAMDACHGLLPEWTEDAFPGFLLNVAAGRVANRFDLGGSNYAVDAACGSSLAAAHLAVRELETGAADMVILGGADTVQNPLTYLAFSKTQAFSPRGRCRPFDASADGIVISEGVSAIVLKRLADAERDGDRIYAVIKGIGSSSDGRARGLTAPSPEGQSLALNRAYEKAGVDPRTIGYVEAHGTGTAVGDVVEAQALDRLLRTAGAAENSCAVGSVKSSIGHTKCAAGMAGLINAALALHHKVMPPTIGVETVNPRVGSDGSPLRISTEIAPWLHADTSRPRRAGVSAFGFGGTNFHAVLEAYDRNLVPPLAPSRRWPAELFAWSETDSAALGQRLDDFLGHLAGVESLPLVELAAVNHRGFAMRAEGPVLAIVAASFEDLKARVDQARTLLTVTSSRDHHSGGIFLSNTPPFRGASIAFVFPGQGTQSPGMGRELAIHFDRVRETIEEFDRTLITSRRKPVGPRIYPPRPRDSTEKDAQRIALRSPEIAQPAVGAISTGMFRLLESLGVRPDRVAGHSYGEFVALHAAGSLSPADLAEVSEARGRFLLEAVGDEPGSMAALSIGPERVREVLNGWTDVLAVNFNGPDQTVVAGTRDGVNRAVASARDLGLGARELPVACAFHTSLVEGAVQPLTRLLVERLTASPGIPVYSNLDACPHPSDPQAIAARMGRHLASPVKFTEMIETMHDDGARVFVECGPSGILSPIVSSILAGRPHVAISLESSGKSGILGLLDALARMLVAGVGVHLSPLTQGRAHPIGTLEEVISRNRPEHSPSTWLVNGSRARPMNDPEPRRLGQALPEGQTPRPIFVPADPQPPRPEPHVPVATNMTPSGDRVLLAFQETMRQFLDLQQSTMNAYLETRSRRPAAVANGSLQPVVTPVPEVRPSPLAPEILPTPEPAPAIPTPVASSRIDREAISARLVAIVCERTGYPSEMLRPDLDLEADLGIDSIKRVEILGSLRESFTDVAAALDPGAMDDLARARSLGAIADRFARGLKTASPVVSASPSSMKRLLIESRPAPQPDGFAPLVEGGVVIVTACPGELSQEIATRLEHHGHPAILVPPPTDETDPLATAEQVEELLDRARALGPIAAIVHLRSLHDDEPAGWEVATWARRLDAELSGLYLLARAAADDLESSARRGGSCLLAFTAMGGSFGSLGKPSMTSAPHRGGVVGLVKTLAREWPTVRVRAVDLPRDEPATRLTDLILSELFTPDPRSEVGYVDSERICLSVREVPLEKNVRSLNVGRGEPILLTGGARGITAAVARELARRWHPRLLIVGTTPAPGAEESSLTRSINDPRTLKSRLLEIARSEGQKPTPAMIESHYHALIRSREVAHNLALLRSEGVEVSYGTADVRDARSIQRLLSRWRSEFGPLAGVIHAAGVIHDKLLRDKTPESFDRVFGTKVFGVLNLLRFVDPEALKFFAMFSSIAGRFGNRGQSDYAAANETLNKIALALDRQIPGRVVSAIWGPWSGVGMVSDLESHLSRLGLAMIAPDQGAAAFANELELGRKGEVEVILAGSLGTLAEPPGPRDQPLQVEAMS